RGRGSPADAPASCLLRLLPLEDPGGGAALGGRRILDDPVRVPALVVLGEVLGDGEALRRDEQQAVAVLPFLHLVARADPAAQLGLRLRIRIEVARAQRPPEDRKSTRLNSSHVSISYAVFC